MKAEKIGCLLFVAVILMIPGVLAAFTTDVNVKTLPNHKVYIATQSSEGLSLLDSTAPSIDSGSEGKVSTSLESGSDDYINIIVKVSKDGEVVVNHRFEELINGDDFFLQVIPGDIAEDYRELEVEKVAESNVSESNKTEEVVEEEVVEESSDNSNESSVLKSVTGFVLSAGDKLFSKTTLYVILVVVGVFVVFVVLRKVSWRNVSSPKMPSFGSVKSSSNVDSLRSAEERLKQAKREIARIKNSKKIDEARIELEKAKERLEKLMEGEED